MDVTRILNFLKAVAVNNNRPWFQEHKNEYLACKFDFEEGINKVIAAIAEFDPEIGHLTTADCCYRFYRDIRFSQDKSPYKRHFGAYICAHGKKALRGGYYIHLQPEQCLISAGSYWLPTNILTACRNEIMGNINEWRNVVENGEFVNSYGYLNEGYWTENKPSVKGFGINKLKIAPKGFPRDYVYLDYLKMKDYACWRVMPDGFFEGDGWIKDVVRYFKIAKPMVDIINSVVDDYE